MSPFMQAYYDLGREPEYRSVWKHATAATNPTYADAGIRFIPRFKEGIMLLHRFKPGRIELHFSRGVEAEIAQWLKDMPYDGLELMPEITDGHTAVVLPSPEIDIDASFASQEWKVRVGFTLAMALAALVEVDRDAAALLVH